MAAQQPLWKAVRDGEFEVRLVTRVRGQSMGEGNVEVQVLYNEVGLQTKVPNPYAHEKSTFHTIILCLWPLVPGYRSLRQKHAGVLPNHCTFRGELIHKGHLRLCVQPRVPIQSISCTL